MVVLDFLMHSIIENAFSAVLWLSVTLGTSVYGLNVFACCWHVLSQRSWHHHTTTTTTIVQTTMAHHPDVASTISTVIIHTTTHYPRAFYD